MVCSFFAIDPCTSCNSPGTETMLLFRVWMEVWLARDHSFFWCTRTRPESSTNNLNPGMAGKIKFSVEPALHGTSALHCTALRCPMVKKNSLKSNLGETMAVVVAQLLELSLVTPEIRGLNPEICKILSTNCTIETTKIKKKRLGTAHL